MTNYIPLCVPHLFDDEKKLVNQCLKSNWISSSGSLINKFESQIAKYTKSKYATACTSGTAALHLAMKVCDIKKNDEVIVPSLTFIATINSIIYVGANPFFVDCDNYFNIDVVKLIYFLNTNTYKKNGFTYNKITKKRIAAILPVHVWGNAVDLSNLHKLCKNKNIKIIEDATEALGTFYNKSFINKHAGTIGDVGCISFNGNKIITTGGGGMLITNKKNFYKKSQYLSNQSKDDAIMFKHNEVGYNYRLNNLQAALGLGQLKNLKTILKNKKFINNFYIKNLKNNKNIQLVKRPDYAKNNNWMNIITIKSNKKIDLKKIINDFEKKRIQIRPVWYPNHLQKPFKKYFRMNLSNTTKLINSSLCLPSSSNLSVNNLSKVCRELNQYFE